MDNINFYSNWIPAWQQTDSYTTQPWCLLSKNVDIFSSSKSIKATAFSEPVAEWDSSVVASEWWLELRADGKIYENWVEILNPATNFPAYDVSYTGKDWTYAPATFWTPQDMAVATDSNWWQSVAVFTDRTIYNYSKIPYVIEKSVSEKVNMNYTGIDETYWYTFKKANTTARSMNMKIKIGSSKLTTWKFRIKAVSWWDEYHDMKINYFDINNMSDEFYYDSQADAIVAKESELIQFAGSWDHYEEMYSENWYEFTLPAMKWEHTLRLFFTTNWTTWDAWAWYWTLYIDMNWLVVDESAEDIADQKNHLMPNSTWDYQEYYGYLPIRDRKLKEIWEYYWLKWNTYQEFYKWDWVWTDYLTQRVIRYEFVWEMSWETPAWMDVISMVEYKEQVYMIGNKNWNWYIIPCDLTWGKWVATIKPWVTFLGAINKDYLIYLCWTDRWVSTLWVYNWQELVPVISWSQEVSSKDLVDYVEQYRFDGSMVIYRNNLVLGTTDNRLFRYWQTYWGRWGSFIYVLPNWATLDKLEAIGNDLKVHYTLNNTKYYTVYQDDVPIQRFNTEYEVVYPIQIWNHIIEKEDTDLYVSYLLPSANTSLEFWAMNNHYQYWTFTSEENATLDTTKNYTMAWAWGTYALKFIERNWNQYTFELDGNLPVQTSNEMKIKDNENTVVLNYTSYNHFRLIWTLSTDKCEESKFRFTGLNNKLNLTKTHSMQIMVKGKWTTQYTPELFALNLVATQRDRW